MSTSLPNNDIPENFLLSALLSYYYPDSSAPPVPAQRPKSEWKKDNKYWFFWAVVKYGIKEHSTELQSYMETDQFEGQEEFSQTEETTFIDLLFNYYILPFHKSYNVYGSRPNTPPQKRSRTNSNSGSRPSSATKENNKSYTSIFSISQFSNLLSSRDKVCLFCWNSLKQDLQGAHIIAKKNTGVVMDEDALLKRAGIENKYVVQNGLLLCGNCHNNFDLLKRYIDPIELTDSDTKYVLKIVNQTNDDNDQGRLFGADIVEWQYAKEDVQNSRSNKQLRFADNRQAVDSVGDMCLYFVQEYEVTDREKVVDLRPNNEALRFHKTACLIWKTAGGAAEPEDYSSDEENDFEPVDFREKEISNWQDSSATINVDYNCT